MRLKCVFILTLMALQTTLVFSEEAAQSNNARELAQLTANTQMRVQYLKAIYEQLNKQLEKDAKLLTEFKKTGELLQIAALQSLQAIVKNEITGEVANNYKDEFTEEELATLNNFFKSPVGKKYALKLLGIQAEAYSWTITAPYISLLVAAREKGATGLDELVKAHREAACDKAAEEDMAKLGAALERFANERIDLDCKVDRIPHEILEYMVGPYYGWAGTNKKCEVLIRTEGDEAWGCSNNGTSPKGADTRNLYGVRISTGRSLPPKVGKFEGRSYPGEDDICFLGTVLGDDCAGRKTKGSPP